MSDDRFQQIPRLARLSREEFEREFLLQRKPVIFTDLFEGELIRELSVHKVQHQLGDVPLMISQGFRPNHLTGENHKHEPHQTLTINEYFDLIDRNPETLLLCSENAVPPKVQKLFSIPDYCKFGNLDNDRAIRLFLGNVGNYAHLHFDGDFRHVLFHQVFGSKKIAIVPVEASPKLIPHQKWSTICLEHFNEAEKDAFISYLGGVQCILNPGETLFFPAAVWHYLEYTTTGMSVAIRFGRNNYTKFLGDKCHLDSKLQGIASRMIDEEIVRKKYYQEYKAIEEAYYQPCQSIREKQQQMSAAYARIWNLIFGKKEPIYQIPLNEQLAESILTIEAKRCYSKLTQSISQFSGWNSLPSVK